MKKVLAVFLAVLMVLSLVPVTSWATSATCPGKDNEHKKDNCSYVLYDVVESVCGELGYTVYQCTECDDYFAADFNLVEGQHAYEKVADAVDATCTEGGSKAKWECSNCGLVDPERDGSAVDALGHDWETVSVTGSCLEGGVVTEKCSRCGEERTSDIEGTGEGHVWPEYPESYVAPSCEANGSATFRCEVCDKIKVVPILATGHTEAIDEAVEATCTEGGLTEGKSCAACGVVLVAQEPIAALGHDWEASNIVGATCTEKGSYTNTCVVCGEVEEVEDAALGHQYEGENDGWVVTVESTCATFGEMERTCTVCGDVETAAAELLAHTYDYEYPEIIPATCTSWGLYVYYCTECGDLKPQNPEEDKIPPLGCTPFDDETSTNQVEVGETCEADGLRTWNCGRCGAAQEALIDEVDGHGLVTVTVEAYCHQLGYSYSYCENDCCTLELVDSYEAEDGLVYELEEAVYLVEFVLNVDAGFNPNRHDTEEEVVQEPSCTEFGSKTVYCPHCSYVEELVPIPALGHDFDASIEENVTEQTAASCEGNQVIVVKCSRCDATEVQEVAESALGHDEVPVEKQDSTCTEVGHEAYTKCSRCDWTSEVVEIEKKPHDYEGTSYGTTCEHGAYIHYVCSVCGDSYDEAGEAYVYDALKEYESFEAAQKIHPQLDEATRKFVREGNCEKTALDEYTCAYCNKTVLVIADNSTGHHLFGEEPSAEKVEATCEDEGSEAVYTCERCGYTEGGEVIEALGHDMSEATCTEAAACQRENCDYVEGEALGHNWSDWAHIDETETAYEGACHKRECGVCGEVETGAAQKENWDMFNPDKAPTCTEAGGWYCDVCNGLFATMSAPGHSFDAQYALTADCTHIGFVYYSCGNCDDESVDFIDGFVAELGHKFEDVAAVDSTCREEGHTAGTQCACGEWGAEIETIPVKDYHMNAAEEVLEDKCISTVEDRFCVWCEMEIGKSHANMFSTAVAPDCNSEGYTLHLCPDCNAQELTDYVPMRTEHDWTEWEVVVEPSYTNAGLEARYCVCCVAEGINVVEEREIPALAGIVLVMDADNANAPGYGYTDSSLVALTITMESVKTEVWGTMFRVYYSENLTFVSAAFAEGNALAVNQMAVDNDGFVSISAFAPNNEQKEMQNVTVEGEMAYVTLYFRVTNGELEGAATTADFSIDNIDIIDVDGAEKTAVAEGLEIVVKKYMDVTGDGDVSIHDILVASKILAGELVIDGEYVEYDVTLDVDKDGEVTAFDVYTILEYLNGALTYEEVIAAE